MRVIAIILSLLILGTFLSCSSDKTTGKTEAEILYKQAQEHMDSGRYLLATEKLNTIKSQYPYSFYATHAELMLADILFLQEEYVESAAAYLLFRDFHPKHEKIAYVIWRIAESYFNQLPPTFDRDLSSANEAIKYYDEILKKYSTTEYAAQAQGRIDSCRTMLRERERYVADFYFKTDKYDAAVFRYEKILREFNDKELVEHSKIRIAESYFELKNFDLCKQTADKYLHELTQEGKARLEKIRKRCEKKQS